MNGHHIETWHHNLLIALAIELWFVDRKRIRRGEEQQSGQNTDKVMRRYTHTPNTQMTLCIVNMLHATRDTL